MFLEERVSIDDERPIWYAIAFENLSMVKFVIARGARADGIVYRKCLTKFENKHYPRLADVRVYKHDASDFLLRGQARGGETSISRRQIGSSC